METKDSGETDHFIDYIDALGETKHDMVVNPGDAKRILKTVIQNEGKQKPGTSYQIRDFLLRNSGGEIDSLQAFTKNSDLLDNYDPYSGRVKDYLQNPNNWIADRKLFHNNIIRERLKSSIELSKQIDDIEPTIYILRGNIASGKTTALRTHPHFERMRNGLGGVISPDIYKIILKNAKIGDVKPLRDMQVHQESLFLADEIQKGILDYNESGRKISLVIDKRFAWQNEIDEILSLAQNKSKKIDIFDVDTPLELSILRVLARDFPRLDFKTFIDGFERIRKYRRRLVKEAEINENIDYYVLVDTGIGGIIPSYLDVTRVVGQKPEIIDAVRFDQLAPKIPEDKVDEEIEKGKRKDDILMNSYIIDDEYIRRVQKKYLLSAVEARALEKYTGMTPAKAVDKHNLEPLD